MKHGRLRRHLARFGRLLRRPPADQWLVMQAFVLLGHSRYLIKRRGLKAVEPMLGERMVESTSAISPNQAAEAERIGWAVTHVSIYTPWTSNCFPQALTAKRLLRRHGVSSTVYLGAMRNAGPAVASTPETGFAAHAWVRSGERFVTGSAGRELYTPILWFSDGLSPSTSTSIPGVSHES